MHTRTEGKKSTWKEYCTGRVISDIRDLNEAYQYFKKKYREKWKKKEEVVLQNIEEEKIVNVKEISTDNV